MALFFKDSKEFHLCPIAGAGALRIVKSVFWRGNGVIDDEHNFSLELIGETQVRPTKEALELMKEELKKGWGEESGHRMEFYLFNQWGLILVVSLRKDGGISYHIPEGRSDSFEKWVFPKEIDELDDVFRR